jgi:hypothetical protein
MKYKTKQAKASKTIELKLDIDNKSEKVKLLWQVRKSQITLVNHLRSLEKLH